MSKVLSRNGEEILQYSTTEGYKPLRDYIAGRYAKIGLEVGADEILITNGSQQGIDLVGKVFLNREIKYWLKIPLIWLQSSPLVCVRQNLYQFLF